MQNEINIENLLRKELFDLSMQPELRSFEAIQSRIRISRRRKILFYLWLPVGFGFILGMILFGPANKATSNLCTTRLQDLETNGEGSHSRAVYVKRKHSSADGKNNAQKKTLDRTVPVTTLEATSHSPGRRVFNRTMLPVQKVADISENKNESSAIILKGAAEDTQELLTQPDHLSALGIPFVACCNETLAGRPEPALLVERKNCDFTVFASAYYNGIFESAAGFWPAGNKKSISSANSKFNYSQAYGIKLGLGFKSRWQILLQTGTLRRKNEPVPQSGGTIRYAYNYSPVTQDATLADLSYWTFGLEGGTFISTGRYSGLRLAVCSEWQRLQRAAHFSDTWIRRSVFCLGVKAGWMENISRRLQLLVSPNLSFCPGGIAVSGSAVRRPIGLGLEANLLYRIFR